jgi:nucleoside transporter
MTTLNYQPALATPRLGAGMQARLSLMMFLQFAIQGAWLPLLLPFLDKYRHFSDQEVGILGAMGAVGAVISPFIAGQLADRYMNAERFLSLAHVVGAITVWLIAEMTGFYPLFFLALFYGILYTPTLAVCNAIAFAHLPDRDRDFGKVRVWGTIGWIAAGIAIGHWLLFRAGHDRAAQIAATKDAFRLSAILGIIQGLYALTLPRTPPRKEIRNYAPAEAIAEVRRQPLLTIFLISIPIAAVHAFFFARTADFLGDLQLSASWADKIFGVGGAGLMTVGQISEIVVLAIMPLIVTRVPRKVLLSIGLCAYILRFAIFAYSRNPAVLIAGLALHGVVFGCFFFLCFMLVDQYTTKDVRSSAQNLFNLIVFGVGVIIGNLFAGYLAAWTRLPDKKMNWTAYYAVPMWITVACLVIFLIAYPARVPPREDSAPGTVAG